jgi:hypothetical protein
LEVTALTLIKVLSDYAAIRVLKVTDTKIIWQFVTGSQQADQPIESKRIDKSNGFTYWIRHDSMYLLQEFKEEKTEFTPKG